VRIWIDMTAAAHPLVFRPIIERLQQAGHDVHVTSRDYGQTLGLADRLGIEHTPLGQHGESRRQKATALLTRGREMRRFGKRHGPFDLAAAHGSNDLPIAARLLGVPAVDLFDYEYAIQQHNIGCRLARRVITPDSIPPERLYKVGATPQKLRQYPGLKEEYYLSDFEPDEAVLGELGLDRDNVIVVMRPPPEVSMYHRENPLFGPLLESLGRSAGVQTVVIPRVEVQARGIRALQLPNLIVPEHAVDAQSLIAFADLVVSAGGTMNREAVALGTPVYSTFSGRLGGVDEWLMREGRLRPLDDPQSLELVKKGPATGERVRRDPQLLVDLILEAAR
jgi:predicted glycosyltransferase